MQKKKSNVANRAWRLLRLALLWARKGGVFKNSLMVDLRLFPKFLKTTTSLIGRSSVDHRRAIVHYGERQLSFDKTPVIHVKMYRPSSLRFRLPHIPCINPQLNFDYDLDDGDVMNYYYDGGARKSFLKGGEDHEDCEEDCEEMMSPDCGDEGIDIKAEEFIARFYEQMKMQRQVSYLQYHEMHDV